MRTLFTTTLGRLRVIAFLEGLSFLILLCVAMPLKRIGGHPEFMFPTGMTHGILFVLYVLYLVQVKIELNWSFKTTLLAFIASLVPFGTFYADVKLFRE